jgi:rhomboid family GlyGly-CTERM serine protease
MAVLLAELPGERGRIALRFDRHALAGGQLWRLLTGHLVHLGPSHMLMNLVALAVLAAVLAPWLRARDWIGVTFIAALFIDAGLYWLQPSLQWYVGLSGVLHGYWAAACIYALADRAREGMALTAMILLKLTYEQMLGPIGLTSAIADGPVVIAAHAWGATGGCAWASAAIATRRWRRSL